MKSALFRNFVLVNALTPLLLYGYNYKAYCVRLGL